MRRREFIGLLGGSAVTWPLAARTVDARKVHRIAVCTAYTKAALSTPFYVGFFEELARLGYLEGTNLVVDRYAADGQTDRYPQMVRDVLQSSPDLIVTTIAHDLIVQFGKATRSIAIVAGMGDPVAAGIVTNLARPEANITGVTLDAGIEMQGKHLELLREAVPSVSRVVYLSPREQWEGAWGRAAVEAGKQFGISIIGVPMESSAGEQQYREAFELVAAQRADALMVNGFGTNYIFRRPVAELALKYRLPSIFWTIDSIEVGGLMVYAPDYNDVGRHLADKVDQILKGAKPGDIPVDQPTKFSLAINLKTAKVLGLALPATLLAQADRVIE